MSRQIVLDTETTGFDFKKGDRIVEIGCIELIDREITDNHFHVYINPERSMPIEAFNVHGLGDDFLKTQPVFAEIGQRFLDYVDGAELIIHNAGFDVPFLNFELERMGLPKVTEHSSVIDTLQMAREKYPSQRNTLDALCRRLGVDNSRRELHGALLDSELLAQVYLNMTGGQKSFFDLLEEETAPPPPVNSVIRAPQVRIEAEKSAQKSNEESDKHDKSDERGIDETAQLKTSKDLDTDAEKERMPAASNLVASSHRRRIIRANSRDIAAHEEIMQALKS